MKKIIISAILLFTVAFTYSQNTITGTFPGLANKTIELNGFWAFDTYVIGKTKADEKGVFHISYSDKDYGMGFLSTPDNKSLVVVLSGEAIKVKGENFALPQTIKILEGKENKIFEQYAMEHPRREQTLGAWEYLEKIYAKDSLFIDHKEAVKAIKAEKQRIKNEDNLFLSGLESQSYANWYLPLRKLVSSVATVAQYRSEEIPATIAAFRKIDYSDPRMPRSGLLRNVVESQFWLIENGGFSTEEMYKEMNKSIDVLVENFLGYSKELNEVTKYLFKFLEKRSLFKASEYLALKLLNEQGCTLNNDFAAQLESYRKMKKGNIAPDILFNDKECIARNYETIPQKLSDLNSKYTVLVFGASWCPKCPEELSKIMGFYKKWKSKGIEVVFVSLDEKDQQFRNFAEVFPFISVCDYKKWESQAVKNYYVFGTPTIYLLDSKREILLRPNSVDQLEAWINIYAAKK